MTERATLSELHEFANAVRKAGGGNPIDALMPSVPEDTSQCLIARNLNFNCEVMGAEEYGIEDSGRWVMATHSREVRNRIAQELHLRKVNLKRRSDENQPEYAVLLPKRIGQVAADFDTSGEILAQVTVAIESAGGDDSMLPCEVEYQLKFYSDEERKLALEMAPYIEASEAEAKAIATFVNPDGSIVI